MTREIETPVLIAGGGPVGMTLALNLARYGVPSLLVERNPTTTRHPKMDLTNGRSMELFKRLGINDRLRAAGIPPENPFDVVWLTSLAGHELHRFKYPSAQEATRALHEKNDGSQASEAGLRVSQIVIEPVLKQATDENPLIDVRFSTAFERIVAQDAQGITAEISDAASGEITQVRCKFLAGCDGGGSRVRRQLGIELDGELAAAQAYMVHFRSKAPELFRPWGITWHYQSASGTTIAQDDKEIYTLQAWIIPGLGVDKMTPGEVLERWAGTKFDYEVLQSNQWAGNFVVARRYRSGRVLLAGDAAHQFFPTGGYGMNSGIADAAALSWVLAAQVQGWGGPALLDAYDRERRPTAWWHLEASRRHVGVRIEIDKVFREAGDLDGGGADAEARRREAGEKIARLGNAENESWGVELGYRYDASPVIFAEPNPPPVDPLTYRPSTWPGARLPHVFLEDGVSVHDKLGLYFTLLALDDVSSGALEEMARELNIPLAVVRLHRPDLRKIYERNLLLVRPDQHVAWRGDALPKDLRALLTRVTGH